MLMEASLLVLVLGTTTAPTTNESDLSAYEEDLRRKFSVQRADLDGLIKLLEDEVTLSVVGDDRVDKYWKRDAGWDPGDWRKTISEEQMLEAVGLSRQRYDSYLSLLRKLDAYRVEKRSDRVRICVRRWGTLVTGGMWNVVKFSRPPEALPTVEHLTDEHIYGRGEAAFYIRLGEEYYIEYLRQ